MPQSFFKKENLRDVFSCEHWEIFKESFFYRTPAVVVPFKFKIMESGSLEFEESFRKFYFISVLLSFHFLSLLIHFASISFILSMIVYTSL